MQQKETKETFTPVELYGARKLEAVRELKDYLQRKAEAERCGGFAPKTFSDAIYAACELGHFKEHLALWGQWPERVETYDEWNQSRGPYSIFKKYGVE